MYRYDEPPDWEHYEDCQDPEPFGNCTCDELDETLRIESGEARYDREKGN